MKKFVLELTPLNQNDSIYETLKLGDWNREKADQQSIEVEYHWNDREKLKKDYDFIFILFEKYLSELSDSLNKSHKTDYPLEYWRMVIGPWLYYFISILFDRYESIRVASAKYDIQYAELPIYNSDDWIPNDYIDFYEKYYSDEWNYFLYSEIIRNINLVSFEESSFTLSSENKNIKVRRISFLKKLLFLLTKLTRNFPKKVLFVEVDIPQKFLYKILYKLKSFSFSYFLRKRVITKSIDKGLREDFFRPKGRKTEFENLLDLLIPKNIPSVHLESYEKAKQQAKAIFPDKIKLIITSNAYFSNEHFKIWAAEKKIKHSNLWVLVHGGHHGTALFNGPGELTENIANRFYSWGWGKYNLPSSKLSLLKNKKIPKSGTDILFIPYEISKYSNHIDSSPIAQSFNGCLAMHFDFFQELKKNNLDSKVLIRLKSGAVHRNLEKEYREATHIDRYVYSDKENLFKSIERSELVIVTYDSTVFLESLTLNKPTCLFIRKDFWEMSKESEPYFKEFKSYGILHYNEKSLIEHITKWDGNYEEWWQSIQVQKIRKAFLEKFGLSSNDWSEDWYNEIYGYLKKYEN